MKNIDDKTKFIFERPITLADLEMIFAAYNRYGFATIVKNAGFVPDSNVTNLIKEIIGLKFDNFIAFNKETGWTEK